MVNAGVGDSDEMMQRNRLGVVLKGFAEDDMRRAARELLDVLARPDVGVACRDFAASQLSLADVGGPRYAAVYERLVGSSRVRASAGVVKAA